MKGWVSFAQGTSGGKSEKIKKARAGKNWAENEGDGELISSFGFVSTGAQGSWRERVTTPSGFLVDRPVPLWVSGFIWAPITATILAQHVPNDAMRADSSPYQLTQAHSQHQSPEGTTAGQSALPLPSRKKIEVGEHQKKS